MKALKNSFAVLVLGAASVWSTATMAQENGFYPSQSDEQVRPAPGAPGPETIPGPDLVINKLTTLGRVAHGPGSSFSLPLRIEVQNRGPVAAGRFKVSVHYKALSEPAARVAQFSLSGTGKDGWYAWASGLAQGSLRRFTGTVLLPDRLAGKTLMVWAVVDSTVGDEFLPAYGRVLEMSEANNCSVTFRMRLPDWWIGPAPLKVQPADRATLFKRQPASRARIQHP